MKHFEKSTMTRIFWVFFSIHTAETPCQPLPFYTCHQRGWSQTCQIQSGHQVKSTSSPSSACTSAKYVRSLRTPCHSAPLAQAESEGEIVSYFDIIHDDSVAFLKNGSFSHKPRSNLLEALCRHSTLKYDGVCQTLPNRRKVPRPLAGFQPSFTEKHDSAGFHASQRLRSPPFIRQNGSSDP